MQPEYKILVVDDEFANTSMLSELLGDAYVVATASSGEEALALLPSFDPDLILLDVMMTGINGHETCRRIRSDSRYQFVKIIMVSARSKLNERLEGYSAGADDYVGKPFDFEELKQKVKVFLRLKRAEEVDRIQGRLLQYFSHETRAPLNGILAPAEELLNNGSLDSEAKQSAKVIVESAKGLLDFIRKVSLLCELKKGLRPDRRKGFLVSHLQSVLEAYRKTASLKSVTLGLAAPDDSMVDVDWKLFDKIVGYIVENAIEHSPQGASVKVGAGTADGCLSITVTDKGEGIKPALMSRIFDGAAALPMRSEQEERKGFSLAIAKEVAALHGGTVTAVNNPDGGATFCVKISFSDH
jgi:two-component system sensor histidine kinase/response regulator